jgi:hypothetical protein
MSRLFVLLCLLLLVVTIAQANAATIHVPADQPTIQAGINAAAPGDTVLVAPGTYYENINFNGKAITVTSSAGATTTIIDGGGIAPVVTFNGGESRASILSNLTIRNGGATPGTVGIGTWGGIFTGLNSNPSILNNLITQNACNGYFGSGGALLQGNTISGTLPPSTPGCSYGEGAAVFLKGNSTTLPVVQVIGNIIENNVHPTTSNWGAITINGYIGPVVENNIIRNNAMTGIFTANSNSMVIAQNLVYGNASTNQAGGLYASIPWGGTGPPVGPPIGIIANNTFVQNSGSQVDLEGSLPQFDFVNNIVVGSGSAAPFLCGYPPADSISPTPIVIDHNDIYNSSGPAYGTGCPDSTGTYGNISADPLFTNPSTQDLHLQSGSPAIDAGNTSVQGLLPKDLDNNPRLQDATGKLYPIVDMGAYEFQSLADANPTTIVLAPSLYEVSGGASITLTAKLLSANGVPTGTVTFEQDNSVIGSSTIDTTGTAAFTTAGLTPGIHAFLATYPGQSAFTPAVAVKIFVLVDNYTSTLTLTASPNPSYQGQPVTFTAVVTPTATPIVLRDTTSSTILATLSPNSSGVATFTTSALTAGNHVISAVYPGDTYHAGAAAAITQQVNPPLIPTATTLTLAPNPAVAFQRFGPTIQVSSLTSTPFSTSSCSPTCTVTITITGLPPGVPSTITTQIPPNGILAINGDDFAAGTYTFTATFNGSAAFASSTSNTVTETILAAPATLTLSVSPNPATQNQTVTLTSNIAAPLSIQAPYGAITFFDGSTPIATARITNNVLSNPATVTATSNTLAPGTHIITASYPGNADFLPATSAPITVVINPNDYSITTPTPNPTIHTEHHLPITLNLASIGTFADQIALDCMNLPMWASCTFDHNNLPLASGGTATTTLTIDTDAVHGYASNQPSRGLNSPVLALILPTGLLSLFLTRRGRLALRLSLFLLTLTSATIALSGCSGRYPPSTPPGTYAFQITAHGASTGLNHAMTVTLNVTPEIQ